MEFMEHQWLYTDSYYILNTFYQWANSYDHKSNLV